ncbi:MAG: SDR family oxidoreductase [Methylococcales bacterium]
MANILIIGCGAIGLELANVLASRGHQVTGLKRQPPVNPGNINFVAADLTVAADLEKLPTHFDLVYFIVSADGRNEQSYRDIYDIGLNNLLSRFAESNSNPRWIFVSSTSVYGQDKGEWVDETSLAQPANANSLWIRKAEQRLEEANPDNITVRFSGIYGPGREYLLRTARQAPLIQQTPPYYTNRIHQDDCVGVLAFLLEQHLVGAKLTPYYLASDDDPAPMWEVISWLAAQMNCPLPHIKPASDAAPMNKRCNNQRLKSLGYQFKYPGYQDGYSALISLLDGSKPSSCSQ